MSSTSSSSSGGGVDVDEAGEEKGVIPFSFKDKTGPLGESVDNS